MSHGRVSSTVCPLRAVSPEACNCLLRQVTFGLLPCSLSRPAASVCIDAEGGHAAGSGRVWERSRV